MMLVIKANRPNKFVFGSFKIVCKGNKQLLPSEEISPIS